MQSLRLGFALVLAGCFAFEPRPQQPDAGPTADAATGDAGETLAQAAERVITTWQRCMTKMDIEVSQLAPAWAELVAENLQKCGNCHETGAYGFVATTDASFLHSVLTAERGYLLQYLTVDLTRGAANAAMIVNEAVQVTVSGGQPPHESHPRFEPSQGLAASESLRKSIQLRLDAGGCTD